MAIHTTQLSPSIEASQPSSLPTPPTILKAETYTWILRPPPFPPPTSSSEASTSIAPIEQCTINHDTELLYELEDIVLSSTSTSKSITGDTNNTTTTNIDLIPSFTDDDFNDTNNNNSSSNNNNMTSLRHPSSIDEDLDFNDFIIYDSLSTSPPASVDLFPPFPS
ncbi:unnamed protein product [Cunninghamella blakesleeana]